jgi:hypothetical protein
MHSANGGEDAIRCPTAGQFGSKALALCRAVALAEAEPIFFLRILDACVLFGFAAQGVLLMSKIFCRLAPALLVLIFSGFAFGDDFKSQVVPASGLAILVHNGQFMVIRNFTQDGGTDRGFVSATKPPTSTDPADTSNVLTAAILDNTTTNPPEIINSVVIAGPAKVTFTCGTGGNCFVSFKKDSN